MRFPENLRRKTRELLAEKAEQERKRLEAKRAWERKLEDLEDLRRSRKKELSEYAKEVSRWVMEFLKSKDAKDLFRAMSRTEIIVFCDSFWQGFPTDSPYCYATLEITKDGEVSYGERYKGMPTHVTKLGKLPKAQKKLIQSVHPDYLKNLARHLRTGEVWNYLLQMMPKRVY